MQFTRRVRKGSKDNAPVDLFIMIPTADRTLEACIPKKQKGPAQRNTVSGIV